MEVKQESMCVHLGTHVHRLPRAFTALLSCLMNPLAEHENTEKKEKKSPYYLDDLMPFVDYKMLGFIMCAGRKSQSRAERGKKNEVGLEIQNFN